MSRHVAQVEQLSRQGKLLQALEYNIEGDLRSFGRGFTVLEKQLTAGLTKEEMVRMHAMGLATSPGVPHYICCLAP